MTASVGLLAIDAILIKYITGIHKTITQWLSVKIPSQRCMRRWLEVQFRTQLFYWLLPMFLKVHSHHISCSKCILYGPWKMRLPVHFRVPDTNKLIKQQLTNVHKWSFVLSWWEKVFFNF